MNAPGYDTSRMYHYKIRSSLDYLVVRRVYMYYMKKKRAKLLIAIV